MLATKFFGGMFPGDPNSGGANRKAIITSLENSLRRLQTDYIDLYWMHTWDETTPIEETMRTLDDLVTSGKVRYIGFSDTPAWKCAEAQDHRAPARLGSARCLANRVLAPGAHRRRRFWCPWPAELGLGITPWSPLKSGILSGKYTRANHGQQKSDRGPWAEANLTDKTYDIIDSLIAIAKEVDSTPARVALAWLAQKPGVSSTHPGSRAARSNSMTTWPRPTSCWREAGRAIGRAVEADP